MDFLPKSCFSLDSRFLFLFLLTLVLNGSLLLLKESIFVRCSSQVEEVFDQPVLLHVGQESTLASRTHRQPLLLRYVIHKVHD